jgi:hypothetical protein
LIGNALNRILRKHGGKTGEELKVEGKSGFFEEATKEEAFENLSVVQRLRTT